LITGGDSGKLEAADGELPCNAEFYRRRAQE